MGKKRETPKNERVNEEPEYTNENKEEDNLTI